MNKVLYRPDYSAARRSTTGQTQIRAASALLRCRAERRHLKNVLADHYPGDKNLELVAKAATSPMTDANTSQLVGLGVANLYQRS